MKDTRTIKIIIIMAVMILTASFASCTGGCNKKSDSTTDLTAVSSLDTIDPSVTTGTSGTSATTKPTNTPKPTETSGTTATTVAAPTATEAPKPTETSGTTSAQATNTPTPTTAPTEAVADPTSTPEPTATPTEVPVETTPEPTATPTPEPTPEPTQDPATVVDYTYERTILIKAIGSKTEEYGIPNETVLGSATYTVTVYKDGHEEAPDATSAEDEAVDEAFDYLRNAGCENPKMTMVHEVLC